MNGTKNIREKPRDTLPENDENGKLLEQYEATITEAKATLIKLQQGISQKEAE